MQNSSFCENLHHLDWGRGLGTARSQRTAFEPSSASGLLCDLAHIPSISRAQLSLFVRWGCCQLVSGLSPTLTWRWWSKVSYSHFSRGSRVNGIKYPHQGHTRGSERIRTRVQVSGLLFLHFFPYSIMSYGDRETNPVVVGLSQPCNWQETVASRIRAEKILPLTVSFTFLARNWAESSVLMSRRYWK